MVQRAEEIQSVEPRMAYYCRLYAIKRVSSSGQQQAAFTCMHLPGPPPGADVLSSEGVRVRTS